VCDEALVFDAAPLKNRATRALDSHTINAAIKMKKARVYESWLNLVRRELSDGALHNRKKPL
jgi:hypothetical protein